MASMVPDELARILDETPELKESYLAGGCVRDWLLGALNKDFDIEVFGVSYGELARALSRWGRTDMVGRSFGVVKLATGSGCSYDFTVPRRDSKKGPGHKGFEVEFDPGISPRDASSRRDYTINSMLYDPRAGRLLDFFGGQEDLREGRLRHTGPAFVEDPLRVLRGMQFCGRFSLEAAAETVALCREIKEGFSELSIERVREEWFKWAEKSAKPSAGLRFLAATEWVDHFPEIKAMMGTPQDAEWHPEGDVFVHTCHCCDALAGLPEWRAGDSESRVAWMLAVLAHDFGKAETTREETKEGRARVVSPGHEVASGALADRFLSRIGAPGAVRERVLPLVVNHMAHFETVTDRSVRRLARRLAPETIEGLSIVMTADRMGRPPLAGGRSEAIVRLLEKAGELQIRESAPRPILQGRHLLELGMGPGPEMGRILHEAFEAQLEGAFFGLEEAIEWVRGREDYRRLAGVPGDGERG